MRWAWGNRGDRLVSGPMLGRWVVMISASKHSRRRGKGAKVT